VLSIAFEEGEDLRGPLGRLFEGRSVAAVVEKHEARVGDVVEDRDRCRPSVQLARDAPMARELFPLANDDRKSQVRK